MPPTYEPDDRRRRVTLTAAGAVALEESMIRLERKAQDGAWDFATVYDGRDRDGSFDSADIVHLVSRIDVLSKQYDPPGPLAIVRVEEAGATFGALDP